ncbi:Lipopolysaccharide biosynthesis protein [Butyrivibrio fibrisolvens 16/4]|nr:Lipopolysaccharide biosynthesis protein [Butyrivibrio fibrisolvens 16/4]
MSFNVTENSQLHQNRYAVFAYLFFDDLFEESLRYFSNLPNYVDIYVATNTEEKVDVINGYIPKMLFRHNVKVLLHNNKGRDVSALLVLLKRYYSNYDVICFVHDKNHLR